MQTELETSFFTILVKKKSTILCFHHVLFKSHLTTTLGLPVLPESNFVSINGDFFGHFTKNVDLWVLFGTVLSFAIGQRQKLDANKSILYIS
jgi:hypothetical protein